MQETANNDKNILLNKMSYEGGFHIEEFTPPIEKLKDYELKLTWDASGNIRWKSDEELGLRLAVIADDHSVYFDETRIGLGRKPLHNYKIDLSVPVDTRMTAFHIGDGTFGFSLGNGTTQGFIPEIVGMGASEEDAGLYFLGKTSSSLPSDVPLIIIDGRNADNTPLKNRPILGITNGNYFSYVVTVDSNGNVGIGKKPEIYKLEVNGIIRAEDMITNSSVSLKSLKDEIEYLKVQLNSLITK
jgi:hypothetical protein